MESATGDVVVEFDLDLALRMLAELDAQIIECLCRTVILCGELEHSASRTDFAEFDAIHAVQNRKLGELSVVSDERKALLQLLDARLPSLRPAQARQLKAALRGRERKLARDARLRLADAARAAWRVARGAA